MDAESHKSLSILTNNYDAVAKNILEALDEAGQTHTPTLGVRIGHLLETQRQMQKDIEEWIKKNGKAEADIRDEMIRLQNQDLVILSKIEKAAKRTQQRLLLLQRKKSLLVYSKG